MNDEKHYRVFTQSGKQCGGQGHLSVSEACYRVMMALARREDIIELRAETGEGDGARVSSVQPVGDVDRQAVSGPLENFSTRELVEELSKREGVERTTEEPYQDVPIMINGPAVVLVITD